VKVIISEQQYKTLICEGVGDKIKSILSTNKEIGLEAIDEFKKQTNFDYRFLVSYAAGIGALFNPIWDFLRGEGFSGLNEVEVSLLLISAISVIYQKTKESSELRKLIDEKGLTDELNSSISFIERVTKKLGNMIYALPGIVDTGTNILAYTFLLPIMSYLIPGLYTFDVSELIPSIVAGILLNKVTNFSGKYVSTLLKRLVNNMEKNDL